MRLKLVSWLAALAVVFPLAPAAPFAAKVMVIPSKNSRGRDGRWQSACRRSLLVRLPTLLPIRRRGQRLASKLPADVEFTGVPALFGRAWVSHAQFYLCSRLFRCAK